MPNKEELLKQEIFAFAGVSRTGPNPLSQIHYRTATTGVRPHIAQGHHAVPNPLTHSIPASQIAVHNRPSTMSHATLSIAASVLDRCCIW